MPYWDFVFGEQRGLATDPVVAAYMSRHSQYHGFGEPVSGLLKRRLVEELGEPG